MSKPRLLRTEGIVIKRIDVGEADKIVTLYTPYAGKLRAVAKGARRPTSKLGGHVELFTHSTMLLAKGRNLDIVTQCQTVHPFVALREDLRRTTLACCVAEVIDRLTADHVENTPLFALLLETLRRLNDGPHPEIAVHLFEVQMLDYLGYRPQLQRCVQCETVLGPAANFFSPVAGGALCYDCGHAEPAAHAMTVNGFKVLRLLQAGDYATTSRLRLDTPLQRELDGILRNQINFVLEGELKSAVVLRALAAANQG